MIIEPNVKDHIRTHINRDGLFSPISQSILEKLSSNFTSFIFSIGITLNSSLKNIAEFKS